MEVERGRFVFDGTLTNTNANYLMIFAQVSLEVFDESGEKTTYHAFGNIWATPFKEIEIALPFSRQLPEGVISLSWCEHDLDVEDRKSCKYWNITEIAGVSI